MSWQDEALYCACCHHWVEDWLRGTSDDICADCEEDIHDD